MSSEDFDMNDSTWMSADPHLASSLSPNQEESMRSPQNLHSQEDGECPLAAAGRALIVLSGLRVLQVTLGVSLLYLKAGVVSVSAVPTAPERAGCSLMQSPQARG